jgi:pimeloyl-ACP methyl ester carboxylesterase
MALDTIAFIETAIGGPVHVLGCSDGAILALTVALRRPDLVRTKDPVQTFAPIRRAASR